MGFRNVNFAHLAKFNSSASSEFLEFYENLVDCKIREKYDKPASQTFAPSSFSCSRKSWFRLRGVQPDSPKSVDRTLNFAAEIGTACHMMIQKNLKSALGSDWIAVKDFLAANPIPYKYTLEESDEGLETKVSVENPPVHFACDGIIRWNGQIYLLEIKTAEYSSFDELTDPKSIHVDQIKCYATLLNISHVLVLYQDRQYGCLKCYEMTISQHDKDVVMGEFDHVQFMVEANLAPDRLPRNDYRCTQCEYAKRCKEWG